MQNDRMEGCPVAGGTAAQVRNPHLNLTSSSPHLPLTATSSPLILTSSSPYPHLIHLILTSPSQVFTAAGDLVEGGGISEGNSHAWIAVQRKADQVDCPLCVTEEFSFSKPRPSITLASEHQHF